MEFSIQIKLDSNQVKEIICDYLRQNSGFEKINPKNIHFLVKTIETGSEMCPMKELIFQGITVEDVKIGRGKFE